MIFLGSIGFSAAGTLGSKLMMPYRKNVKSTKILELSRLEENLHPLDIKINVRPVYTALIHAGVWEGPCISN